MSYITEDEKELLHEALESEGFDQTMGVDLNPIDFEHDGQLYKKWQNFIVARTALIEILKKRGLTA